MERQIEAELRSVQRFLRADYFWRGGAMIGIVTLAFALVLLGSYQYVAPALIFAGAGVAFVMLILFGLRAFLQYKTLSKVAEQIESHFPELQQRLLTSVTYLDRAKTQASESLTDFVMHQSLEHSRDNDWRTVDACKRQPYLRAATVLCLGIAAPILWNLAQRPAPDIAERAEASVPQQAVSTVTTLRVLPGTVDLERGSPLVISAQFDGPLPRRTQLVVNGADGSEQTVPMSQRLKDPVFAYSLPQVRGPLSYRIQYDDQTSKEFSVNVFDFPELVQSDAKLDFPEYTKLPDKTIMDTRRVSAVQGSELTWETHLNKPVSEAWLEDEAGQRIELIADAGDPQHYRTTLRLETNTRWKVLLRDTAGRANKFPAELSATVGQNRPPKLDLASAGDVDVSPLQELPISAKLWDDFGVTRYGVAFAMAAQPIKELALGADVAAKQQVQMGHLLDFESLEAEPDQLLAYHFWAEDLGPDGQPRRTQSDIYFAEVRHFEEIFREGNAPPSGEQQSPPSENEQQAEQLLELQKQIISATWNVKRDHSGTEVGEGFSAESLLLLDSQMTAHEQATAATSNLRDDDSKQYLTTAMTFMMDAIKQLQISHSETTTKTLNEAVAAEQSAYQSLLKLRAREHEVSRSQSQASSSSSSSRQQRQKLQQLELKNDQDRYETERQATTQQQTERAEATEEMREVLQGLQDLARRQKDLNRQLQELQIALQKAEETEQEELQRRLERLREQQEELLRDTDEVDQNMSETQNQPEMQQSRQQLEQSREELRKSAEAVERGEVGQALAAGTRAERQFRETSEALRQQTANQFEDQLSTMRNLARELTEEQDKLASEIRSNDTTDGPGLRASNSTRELVPLFEQQEQRVGDLLKQMEQTIGAAEGSEPLLAQKLYDGLRQANRDKIPETLRTTRGLLDSDLKEQAETMESRANQAIKRLSESVDRAAEGVLGNELEGLRRAAGELSALAEQLNRELTNNAEQDGDDNNSAATETGEGGREAESQPNERGRERREGEAGQGSGQGRGGNRRRDQANRLDSPSTSDSTDDSPRQNTDTEPPQDADRPATNGGADQAEGAQQADRPQSGSSQTGQSPSEQDSAGQSSGEPSTNDASSNEPSADGQSTPDQAPSREASGRGRGRGGRDGEGQGQGAGQRSQTASAQPGGAAGGLGQPSSAVGDSAGLLQTFGGDRQSGPISGEGYRDWSDRLRDVEEMLESPELRARAAQIRDRARNIRRDIKRQSKSPQWSLVEDLVATPLEELRQRVELELARQSGQNERLAPIDRDPVPNQFSERVRRYYERLGQGTAP